MDTNEQPQPHDEKPSAARAGGRRRGILLAWGVLAIGAAVAAGAYFAFFRGDDNNASTQVAAQQGTDVAAEQAGIVDALEKEGVLPQNTDASQVEGALVRGANGQVGGKHDNGVGPTFTQLSTLPDDQLVSMFPEGYVTKETLPTLKSQIMAVRDFAKTVTTVEQAQAAGFYQATNDVPFMGEHWLNSKYLTDGVFDPSKPEGLLFSTVDGSRKLVGVWFLQIPGMGQIKRDVEPTGFETNFDLWHAHIGLCIVKLKGASEGETRESCEAKGGNFTADLRWMMHVWVEPEATDNPRGVFGYLNSDLFQKQQATKAAQGGSPSGNLGN